MLATMHTIGITDAQSYCVYSYRAIPKMSETWTAS